MSLATRPTWHTETGEWSVELGDFDLAVSIPYEGVMRVALYPRGRRPEPTVAIAEPGRKSLAFETQESFTGIRGRGGGMDFYFRLFFPHSGEASDGDPAERLPFLGVYAHALEAGRDAQESLLLTPADEGWEISFPLRPADRCFGLGEKTGYLDRRGRVYTMWNTDDGRAHVETLDPLYASIPWLIHAGGDSVLGLYLDDPRKTRWDLGCADPARAAIRTPGPAVDLYLVAGPDLPGVMSRYARLTGKMPLPPRWALGYQQCRYSYMSSDRVREVAREFREREIPCDVLYMDIDYMDEYRVFTWDPERFAEPAALCQDLDRQGFRTVTIVDPGVKKEAGYAVYDTGLARDAFVRDADGVPYVGEVWPGKVCFPDFSRPDVRRWWGDQHAPLLGAGVSGIWNDMNEPADFSRDEKTLPEDALHADGKRHAEVHNLYALFQAQATHEALLRERPEERPFVLTRAGFAGIQRFAAMWTGDNHSIWLHLDQALPMALNLGLSGLPFVGPDVGGFSGDTHGELLARWTQLGALTPFFRNHTCKGTRDQEPWAFGPDVEAICRRYIRLRYELLPYLYTQFRRAADDGTPIFRPLAFHYPQDPEAWTISDQALVGEDLLVCPITRPGATRRAVCFPAGDWYDFWTGARFQGPDWRVARADLATLPLFVRAGAVLPRSEWGPSTALQKRDVLILEVYPGPALCGEWYDDDGLSFRYRDGAFSLWRFRGGPDEEDLRLTLAQEASGFESPEKRVRVIVRAVAKASRVTAGGRDVPFQIAGGDLVAEASLEPAEWVFHGVYSV